jgi:hypothetical protein
MHPFFNRRNYFLELPITNKKRSYLFFYQDKNQAGQSRSNRYQPPGVPKNQKAVKEK